jgi:hypothetical protein
MNEITNIVIQVIVGIIAAFVIYVAFLQAMKIKALVSSELATEKKQQVVILDGVLNSNETSARSEKNTFNTTLPFLKHYMPINPSVNLQGGTQFSYGFWLFVKDPRAATNKSLFLKGDKKQYTYNAIEQVYDPLKDIYRPSSSQVHTERVVMCPQVSFGEHPMDFDITFNTFDNMHEKVSIKRKEDTNSLKRNNLLSLFTNKWVNITITFQDNSSINDYQRGILIRFYVNGIIYHVAEIPGLLKQNRGNFYVFPDGSIPDCKMADLKYFNFALSDGEIMDYIKERPETTKSVSDSNEVDQDMSTYTGLQNHLDIYNT